MRKAVRTGIPPEGITEELLVEAYRMALKGLSGCKKVSFIDVTVFDYGNQFGLALEGE